MWRSGYCCQLGEVQPPAVHPCPVSWDDDRHIPQEGVPVRSSSGLLSGSADFLRASSIATSVHVAAVVGPHGFTGPLQWRLRDHLAVQIPLLPECLEAVRWWLQENRWVFGDPLQVSPPSLLLHNDVCVSGWGAHLLDLTASGVCLQEESSLHINMLEMKVIVPALAVFQLSGQSVVLMSDNTTVVAYLSVSCHMAAKVVL